MHLEDLIVSVDCQTTASKGWNLSEGSDCDVEWPLAQLADKSGCSEGHGGNLREADIRANAMKNRTMREQRKLSATPMLCGDV